eukprot:TRINITY_DN57382_c0_g1_i1.p1 TRINITY_DN57382_c0_g1~~TRINITY_DN57382_c0_g1_i1.p1  ORF type:complete len:143 (+),score=19.34 TRINITY_DN57382_c0_g1_i1:30-431(+)
MVVALLYRLHGNVLRCVPKHSDEHFTCLAQASRHHACRTKLSSKKRRTMKEIDTCFAIMRPITGKSCETFLTEIEEAMRGAGRPTNLLQKCAISKAIEQIVDVPVPMAQEEVLHVSKVIQQERHHQSKGARCG